MVAALAAASDNPPDTRAIADAACRLEAVEAGIPGGRQDQFTAAYGGFLLLRFCDPDAEVTPLRMPTGFADELARRRLGYGRGPRMRFERDDVEFLSGVRHGRTLGSPVSILIRNTEWPKWVEEMSPAPGATAKPLHQPRPGHADLAGMQKYGFDDARDVLERASARETAARVAAGTLAKALLSHLGMSVLSHVIQIGSARNWVAR